MSKNVKIFLVKGISIEFEEGVQGYNQLNSVVGYFTNLKELYNRFDSKTIQSYSTVCSHLNKTGYYISNNSRFRFRESVENYNEVTISQVWTNRLYQKRDYVSLSEILRKESNNMNERKEFLTF